MSQQIPYKSITNTGKDNDINSLNVSGITTITNTTESTSSTTGALVVSGGVGIAEKLFIGNDLNVGDGVFTVDKDNSRADVNGLVVSNLSGGQMAFTAPQATDNIGIVFSHNVPNNVRYDIYVDNANDMLQVGKNAGDGTVLFGDTTESTSTTTGTIRCSGGVGIVKNLHVGGDFYPKTYTNTSKFIETSTWTPTVTFSVSGSLDTSSASTKGRWYRIGRMVFVSANVSWDLSTSGTIDGEIQFVLPHTISTDNESSVAITLGTMKQIRPPASSTIASQISTSTNIFTIRSTPIAGGNLTTLTDSHLGGTDGFLTFSCNYLIDL